MRLITDIKRKINGYINEYWNVGFVLNDLSELIENQNVKLEVKWIKHNYPSSERWFADPFILDVVDDKIYLLVEEWYAPIDKGRISKLVIDRKTCELLDIIPILQLDTHLSFPAIYRNVEGHIYIHPENSKSGKHVLYEYFPNENNCKWISNLVEEPLTDTVFYTHQNKNYMFTTIGEQASKNVLEIYQNIENQFVHIDSFMFSENLARMAGDFFEYNGIIYRPAQECNDSYGHAVSIQKAYYDGKWIFKEVNRLYSPSDTLKEGLHTFNMYKGVIVVDAVGHHGSEFGRGLLNGIRSFLARYNSCN